MNEIWSGDIVPPAGRIALLVGAGLMVAAAGGLYVALHGHGGGKPSIATPSPAVSSPETSHDDAPADYEECTNEAGASYEWDCSKPNGLFFNADRPNSIRLSGKREITTPHGRGEFMYHGVGYAIFNRGNVVAIKPLG